MTSSRPCATTPARATIATSRPAGPHVATNATPAAKRAQTGGPTGRRNKIDWVAARRWYARNPTASSADVGRKFGVSDTAVRKHMVAEGWVDYRVAVQRKAAEKASSKDASSLLAFQERALTLGGKILDYLERAVEAGEARVSLTDFRAVIQAMLQLHGQATDVVEVRNVQVLFEELTQLWVRHATVRAEQRESFLQALDELRDRARAWEAAGA